ncbi:MAG: hypothetical protein RL421_358, partial [Actinomycetota bacterium]
KRSEFKEPEALGNSGRVGYSTNGRVGNVNLALPALTRTRLPSKLNVIGLAGSDLEISANNLPGTKTFPFWETSALNFAFAAVSNGDNSNILAARVARETYGVLSVVARIYDPARAEIYQRLGIPTVATVLWTTDQIMRRILPQGSRSEWQDPSGKVQLAEVPLHREWFGKPISLIEQHTQARVAFITRLGEGLIPNEHTVLQEGDLVHVMVEDSNLTATENSLLLPPGGE